MEEIIKGTPWWVWVILVYLVLRGLALLTGKTIGVKKLFIFPFIFLIWSIHGLSFKMGNPLVLLGLWLISLFIGGSIGYFLFNRHKVKADKKKKLIALPPNVLTLILFLIVFSIKYTFGYLSSTPFANEPMYFFANTISAGIVGGVFWGRTLCYWNKFRKAPHTSLSESKQ